MELSILEIILCVFFLALAITVICRKLHLSIILGYLFVGAIVGPYGLGIAHNSHAAQTLAEFGIVFLMFTIGLEFSLPKLIALKFPVFVMGGLQVILTIAITALVGHYFFYLSSLTAVAIASIVAMSSTAIVVKQLNDQVELLSPHGLNAVSILLFQDLAVIPVIILIAGLSSGNENNLHLVLLDALLKGLLAIILIFFAGRWLLRPLFRVIARTRAIELFTLTVLLVILLSAWITNYFGLSYALGAFLAGLMLAETEFRHQIEVEIRPFRDILLGLFFITIGMLTHVSHWAEAWRWILLLSFALIIGKMLLIIIISRLSGHSTSTACRTGIILAQGGEFGFAILTLALNQHVLTADYGQVVLAALLISIALSPILIRFNQAITTLFFPTNKMNNVNEIQDKIQSAAKKLKNHVIICGYGRIGQQLARLLDKVKFHYIGLDTNAEIIRYAQLAGDQAMYGDATHPGILKAAGLDHAKVLVISVGELKSAIQILSIVKHSHPHLPIILRCRDEFELKQLKDRGASYVIAELFEASLSLSHHLLSILNIPKSQISELMQEVRSKDYVLLQKIFTGVYEENMAETHAKEGKILKPIFILEGSYAINKKLREIGLKEMGIEVVAIRRDQSKFLKPQGNVKILVNDVIVIFGVASAIEEAERKLFEGA